MIVLGFILLVIGYYVLPKFLPDFPPTLDGLIVFGGWALIVLGIIFFLLSLAGRPVGGRQYWY